MILGQSTRAFFDTWWVDSPKVQDQNGRVDLVRFSTILDSGHLDRS